MLTATPLSTIIALARAGALDHAWYQFGAAGYDRDDDDPAALTVKGRLLKDFALRAGGEERKSFYLRSADCYRRAATLRPGTYPLINAATLSLLSGDRAQGEAIAREVIERIAREPDEPETPYWRAATEAEAWLLLGRIPEAQAALDTAVAAAPRAWEDHASTLRQFLAIQQALGGDTLWLDRLRPQRSLHYSAAAAGEVDPDHRDAIAAILREEDVGFGYGALAAGAEIVTAEALLDGGAALHVVLPSDPESFATRLVEPYGADWRRRFDAALEAAETIDHVRPLHASPDRRMVALAHEIALGAAMLNAERLMGEAVALSVGAAETPPPIRAHLLHAAESAAAGAGGEPDSRLSLLALIALKVGSGGEPGFEDRLEQARTVIADAPSFQLAPHLNGDFIIIGYDEPVAAASAARALHRRLRTEMPLRIGGHYGLVPCIRDPFSGALKPTESGADIVTEIAGAIPPDTICVSHDLAALLAARSAPDEAHWIGELQAFDGGSPIGLYALKASEQREAEDEGMAAT